MDRKEKKGQLMKEKHHNPLQGGDFASQQHRIELVKEKYSVKGKKGKEGKKERK